MSVQESPTARQMFSKVPQVTLYFWIIKVLCTTVGETAADFLNINLNFGLTGTTIVTGVLLLIAFVFQYRTKKYTPGIYWLTVGLVSVFGTLATDNLTDKIGMPLEVSTVLFTGLLMLTFLAWYLSEKTLSMHSIVTSRRETFYWLAIITTFALGTASGDLFAEGLGLGYLTTGLIVAGLIMIFSVAWKIRLNSVLSFHIIYILTRPLGASIGDLLSQPANHGGFGLGAAITSAIFCAGILVTVTYLSITKRDVMDTSADEAAELQERGGLWQTAVVVSLLLLVGSFGYHYRKLALEQPTTQAASPKGTSSDSVVSSSPLGDLSLFRTIAQDTLDLLNAGKQTEATTRISDLEYEWDQAQARLKPRDTAEWNKIDGKIDTVLRELRAVSPNMDSEKVALSALLAALR